MQITLLSVKSALVSALLMAVLAIAGYVISLGSVFTIDWKVLVNLGVLAFLTGIVSLVKNYLTTDAGNFAGVVKVAE